MENALRELHHVLSKASLFREAQNRKASKTENSINSILLMQIEAWNENIVFLLKQEKLNKGGLLNAKLKSHYWLRLERWPSVDWSCLQTSAFEKWSHDLKPNWGSFTSK